jgi:hypothetical protein
VIPAGSCHVSETGISDAGYSINRGQPLLLIAYNHSRVSAVHLHLIAHSLDV